MDELVELLLDIKDSVERQIKMVDAQRVVMAEGQPGAAGRHYSQLLHSQLADVEEAIALLTWTIGGKTSKQVFQSHKSP